MPPKTLRRIALAIATAIATAIALPTLAFCDDSSPNIITIVIDDLGHADLSCIGTAQDVQTPNIDAIAQRGVRFTNAYATAPICNASRIALITGCYQQRQGNYWYSGPGLHNPKFTSLAEVLQKQGYKTAYVGKFHHGSSDHPDKRGFPLNHGFDYFFGCAGGTKHYLHHSRKHVTSKDMLYEGPMWVQREQEDIEGFTTELYGTRSRNFIRENKAKPFYLHLSFNAVHNFTHQLPPAYLAEKGLKGFPDMQPNENYDQWRKKLTYPANPEGRAYYLGQLHFLDLEIGRLIKELEEHGIADKTAIVLVGDNGGSLATYANNGKLKGGKYTLFEGGTRVPMIISYPAKFQQGKVSDAITSTMDIFPTVCSLASAPKPNQLDGIDLTTTLTKANADMPDRVLFWDTKAEHAVRKGRWKLLITKKTPNKKIQVVATPKGTFLYDLDSDPSETTNKAAESPKIVEELKQTLKKWQDAVQAKRKRL